MAHYGEYKFKEMNKLLQKEGFEPVRKKGSHVIYKRGGKDTFVVPISRESGTVKGVFYKNFKKKFLRKGC